MHCKISSIGVITIFSFILTVLRGKNVSTAGSSKEMCTFTQSELNAMKNCTVQLEKISFPFKRPPQQSRLVLRKGKYIQCCLLNRKNSSSSSFMIFFAAAKEIKEREKNTRKTILI